jgi:transposase
MVESSASSVLLTFQKVKLVCNINNVGMKCKRTSDGRKLDHHALQVMRQQAIKAVRDGQPVASVAAAFGMNVTTIFRWLAKFAEGGQNALLAKPIPGRPPKVSAEEMRWIAQAVKDNTPQQFKFEFGLWTLSLLRELINRQFGKSLSLESVRRVMKLLGFSTQKPLYQAWQQDPVLVKQWESETYPAIKAEARSRVSADFRHVPNNAERLAAPSLCLPTLGSPLVASEVGRSGLAYIESNELTLTGMVYEIGTVAILASPSI